MYFVVHTIQTTLRDFQLVVKAMDRQSGDGRFDSRPGWENFLDFPGIVYHCTCLTIYQFIQWQAKKALQLITVEMLKEQ